MRLPLVTASILLSAISTAAYLLFPLEPSHAALTASAILLLVLNCTLGLLGVCVNAFLRTIAREREIRKRANILESSTTEPNTTDVSGGPNRITSDETLVQTLEAQGLPADDSVLERLPLLGKTRTQDGRPPSIEGTSLAHMSGVGYGLSTLVTLGVIELCGQYLQRHPTGIRPLYQVQGAIGIVFGTTSMIAVYFLPRASDPLQDNASANTLDAHTDGRPHWTDGWLRIGTVLRWTVIRALPSLFIFLALFSLLADGQSVCS